nr:MAG TPA: hypothetical protein [Caudoviricetes sp.]
MNGSHVGILDSSIGDFLTAIYTRLYTPLYRQKYEITLIGHRARPL